MTKKNDPQEYPLGRIYMYGVTLCLVYCARFPVALLLAVVSGEQCAEVLVAHRRVLDLQDVDVDVPVQGRRVGEHGRGGVLRHSQWSNRQYGRGDQKCDLLH